MTELLFSYGTLRQPGVQRDGELAAADDYEVDDYQRITVPLQSGDHAWVYVFAGLTSG